MAVLHPTVTMPVEPEELEFFAEEEMITIIPNFSLDTEPGSMLFCIGGSYGPFRPNMPVEVPLWLAVSLLKKNKCRIQPPSWMMPDHLLEVLREEQQVSSVFQPLPFYYMEVAHVLFTQAKDCFGNDFYQVRDLLTRLIKMRQQKVHQGLKQVTGVITVKLNNMSAAELNSVRGFFTGTLDQHYKLNKVKWAMEGFTEGATLGTEPSRW